MGNEIDAVEEHASQLAQDARHVAGWRFGMSKAGMPIWRRAVCQLFVVYVAANMAVCALVFAPWALPRETVSGLLGRWKTMERGWRRWFAVCASAIADRIYFWEPNHCVAVFRCEADARKVLYPEKPGAKP